MLPVLISGEGSPIQERPRGGSAEHRVAMPYNRRLEQLRAQLRDPPAVAPIPSAATSAADGVEKKLLTDLQMRRFISDGWLALPVTEMPDLHAELHAAAQKMWEMNGEMNGGSVEQHLPGAPAAPGRLRRAHRQRRADLAARR